MKSFWLFRTNLRPLEYYHQYKTLDEFVKGCHDFYLMQCIWMLEQGEFDEVTVWRLNPKNKRMDDIVFDVNGRKFTQKFTGGFYEVFNYPQPQVTFFRGGFPEYCKLTKQRPNFFGKKLYLGASRRKHPIYGGVYDKVLVESDDDWKKDRTTIPFFKTANPNIFKPMFLKPTYDICWPCNFTQIRYKGQEFFIRHVSQSKFLKGLKIVHLGNKPEVGKKLCQQYGVTNIDFLGRLERPELNHMLNLAKIGLVTSNRADGCPRISTEIMCSGTPLVIRSSTSLLKHYKKHGVVVFKDEHLDNTIEFALQNNTTMKQEAQEINVPDRVSMNRICRMNLNLW